MLLLPEETKMSEYQMEANKLQKFKKRKKQKYLPFHIYQFLAPHSFYVIFTK